jgi:hypothetical protein
VVVYGGEDSHRRPLGDVHVLDLQVCGYALGSVDSFRHLDMAVVDLQLYVCVVQGTRVVILCS